MRHEESTESTEKRVAIDLLRVREGKIAVGGRVTARMQRFRFEEAADDVINDYRVNEQFSIDEVERRIRNHLMPFIGGKRMASIGTAAIREYIVERQACRTTTTEAYNYTLPNGKIVNVP